MRIVFRSAAALALASSLFAQTPLPVSATSASKSVAGSAAASSLAPQGTVSDADATTPIATITGLCPEGSAGKRVVNKAGAVKTAAKARPGVCRTVVSKAQMDGILDTLMPGASLETRQKFALLYLRTMAASGVAQKKNLLSDPAIQKELQAKMEFTTMQVLASALYRRIDSLAGEVRDQEIESYYKEHVDDLTQGEIERIVISKLPAPGQTLDLATLKTKAEEIRARAAKGEDFAQLRIEAAKNFSTSPVPPSAKFPMAHKTGLPASESQAYDLKPGEVAQLIETPGALEIVKLISVQVIPLDSVRAEIKAALANGHLQLLLKDATRGVTGNFNLSYLNLPKEPELFLPVVPHPLPKIGPAAGATEGPPSALVPHDTTSGAPQH